MVASRRRFAALLLLAWSPACREHQSLCPDGACQATSEATGGQPSLGGAAGQAGSSSDECDEDADCQDESVCNGSERCQHGVCKPGVAVECEHGLVCTEGEKASCQATSPWAFFYTQRTLLGLPTAELGRRPLAKLGEVQGSIDPDWGGFEWPVFSPDGSRLWLKHVAGFSSERLFEVKLGYGVPTFQAPPELPNSGLFGLPQFTRDGRSALVTDDYSGAYWIDLQGTETARISAQWGSALDVFEPCGTNSWVSWATVSRFGRLTSNGVTELTLGPGPITVSPDQRYALWTANEERNILIDCLDVEKQIEVGASAPWGTGWSPSSRHFLQEDSDGSVRLFGLDDAGDIAELWTAPGIHSRYWSDDGAYLIVDTDDGWLSLALSHGALSGLQALTFGGSPNILHVGASGVRAWVDAEDGSTKQLVLATYDGKAKVLLAAQPSESFLYADWTHNRAFLQRPADDHEELLMLTFDEPGLHERLLFTSQGILLVDPASDGSGLALTLQGQDALVMYWLPLPSEPDAEVPDPIALDEGIYGVAFQPWP